MHTGIEKVDEGSWNKGHYINKNSCQRAEVDMQKIKEEYEKLYKKSLADAINSETSGHYRAFLLLLLGCNSC